LNEYVLKDGGILINSQNEPSPDKLLLIKTVSYHINNYFLARLGITLALPLSGTYIEDIKQEDDL
jgi:hypothetical protein